MSYDCSICDRRIAKRATHILPWTGTAWLCCTRCAAQPSTHAVLFPRCTIDGHGVRDHNISLANYAGAQRLLGPTQP